MLRRHHLATLTLMLSVMAVGVPASGGQAGRPPAAPPDRAGADQRPVLSPADARLLDAAMRGDLAEVRAALAGGANTEARSDSQMTALGTAALYGRAPVVSALLAAGAKVDADQGGITPLIAAASEGHTAAVEALLAGGASIAGTDDSGMTALMAAASANRVDAVRALLAHGADVNA